MSEVAPVRKPDIFERVFDFFASVKLGVCVMLTCALLFALSTVVWHEPEVIVKHVAWVKTAFEVILVFLTLNLFAVTLSRYPWNRFKIGMLTTHAGLIVTFTGAFITTVRGRDGTFTLAEGEQTDRYFTGKDLLSIKSIPPSGHGGAVPYKEIQLPLVGWTRGTDRDIKLELMDGSVVRIDRYYTKFRMEKAWREAKPGHASVNPIPVARVSVARGGHAEKGWVYDESLMQGPDAPPPFRFASFIVAYHREMDEAAAKNLMLARPEPRCGTLVVRTPAGGPKRIDVKDYLGKPSELPGGYTLELQQYMPDMVVGPDNKATSRSDRPIHPAIRIRVTGPGGFDASEVLVHLEQTPPQAPHINLDDRFQFSYEFDERFTAVSIFRTGEATAAVLVSPPGADGRRTDVRLNQAVPLDDELAIAVAGLFDRPVEEEIACDDAPGRSPAIHVIWSGGGNQTEAWIPFNSTREMSLNETTFYFNYTQTQAALPFVLGLSDFRVRNYEGSDKPASLESLVRVREEGKPEYGRLIRMNAPLEVPDKSWGSWKVVQHSYYRESQASSTFNVSYDPGRPVVYTGFIAVCAGIFFMFWIKPLVRKYTEKAPL
ncbi:MAG: hypothetical protein FD180_1943 [Planctomycetota bacterium]|nr:MAG: hypothetical protein FD180_1943 [Planctomycetota bacterium]